MGGSDGRFVFAVGCGKSVNISVFGCVLGLGQTPFGYVLDHEQGSVVMRI